MHVSSTAKACAPQEELGHSIEQLRKPTNGKPSEQPANSSHRQKTENDGAAIFSTAARSGPQPDKRAGTSGEVFNHARRLRGHAKTVSAVLGEIVWLMSQNPPHKQFFISDLEWLAMTPVLQQQFRLFYAQNKPIGVLLWAEVNGEVAGGFRKGEQAASAGLEERRASFRLSVSSGWSMPSRHSEARRRWLRGRTTILICSLRS